MGYLSLVGLLWAQSPYQDPRSLGMAGAVSSLAEGIHTIGFNPANLAYSSKDFSMSLGGLTYMLENNILSVENYNLFSGADFIDTISTDYVDKEEFLNDLPDEGLRLTTLLNMPTPGINWSRGITAFSSEIVVFGDVGFPKALFNIMMEGNVIGDSLDLGLDEEFQGTAEWAFSFATPMKGAAFGFSLKYLQGLFYLGVDQDSSGGYFLTDTTGFKGSGRYLIKQAIGGSGFALDIGFATEEINGFRLGISLINAFGRIRWLGPSLTKDLFGSAVLGLMPWRENEYFLYTYQVKNVTADKYLQGEPLDSLFINESYTVVETETGLVRSDSLSNEDMGAITPKPFVTVYPAILRIGASKRIEEFGIITMDLVAGFRDELWSTKGWQLSAGMEVLSTPSFPMRLGISLGGKARSQLGIGFGIHKGPIQFDFGVALHNGIWLHTTKGVSLAFGLTLVR
ncbi:DUF5723 family protein [Candidatus Neomarinimicrobiota bacterium]